MTSLHTTSSRLPLFFGTGRDTPGSIASPYSSFHSSFSGPFSMSSPAPLQTLVSPFGPLATTDLAPAGLPTWQTMISRASPVFASPARSTDTSNFSLVNEELEGRLPPIPRPFAGAGVGQVIPQLNPEVPWWSPCVTNPPSGPWFQGAPVPFLCTPCCSLLFWTFLDCFRSSSTLLFYELPHCSISFLLWLFFLTVVAQHSHGCCAMTLSVCYCWVPQSSI